MDQSEASVPALEKHRKGSFTAPYTGSWTLGVKAGGDAEQGGQARRIQEEVRSEVT